MDLSEWISILILLARLVAVGFVVCAFAFYVLGLVEFRISVSPRSKFDLTSMKWDGKRVTILGSLFVSILFLIGMIGSFGLSFWGEYLLSSGTNFGFPMAIYLFTSLFCAAMITVGFSRSLFLGGLLGYFLAWTTVRVFPFLGNPVEEIEPPIYN